MPLTEAKARNIILQTIKLDTNLQRTDYHHTKAAYNKLKMEVDSKSRKSFNEWFGKIDLK